jgi:hypothetical protein
MLSSLYCSFIARLSTAAVVTSSVTVQQCWHSTASGLVIKILCVVVVYLIDDILSTSTQGKPLNLETNW